MLDKGFWNNRYKNQQTGWDIGYPSTPLKIFLDSLNYWNTELQEAYFSYKEAFLKKEEINKKK